MIWNNILKGEKMMDFCYINLWTDEEEVILIKPTLLDRIKFYFLRKKIKSKIKMTYRMIKVQKCSEIDLILKNIGKEDEEIWDNLLYIIIINQIAIAITHKYRFDLVEQTNLTLKTFFSEIKKKHKQNEEVLKLEVEVLKIKAKFNLITATL